MTSCPPGARRAACVSHQKFHSDALCGVSFATVSMPPPAAMRRTAATQPMNASPAVPTAMESGVLSFAAAAGWAPRPLPPRAAGRAPPPGAAPAPPPRPPRPPPPPPRGRPPPPPPPRRGWGGGGVYGYFSLSLSLG